MGPRVGADLDTEGPASARSPAWGEQGAAAGGG
jgi:hypothetical protein